MTDEVDLSGWPEGTRLIVRRERSHPGAQFEVFDAEGYRHTVFITDQGDTDIAALELRHRRRAKVEDEIRTGKETGMRNLPFAAFEHNRFWLDLSLIAQELLGWARALCLRGELTGARRAQAPAPAPPARRRQGGALCPAHDPAPAALLAVGGGVGRGLRPDCAPLPAGASP